jgi:hypothetical protein
MRPVTRRRVVRKAPNPTRRYATDIDSNAQPEMVAPLIRVKTGTAKGEPRAPRTQIEIRIHAAISETQNKDLVSAVSIETRNLTTIGHEHDAMFYVLSTE